MAEEKKPEVKKTLSSLFREKLQNREQLKETVLEGLKSTNARVRAIAIKAAFKLKDHELIKKHVLPLINSDKSKKVLRTVSEKITRKDLAAKLKAMLAQKKAKADAPATEAPKA
jgi:hypothetical protein